MPTEYNTDCFVSFRFVGLFHVTADAQAGTTIHFRVDIGREEGKPTPMPAEWGRDSRLLIKDLNVELTDDESTKGPSLPGQDGPHPDTSSGGRAVRVLEPHPYYIGHEGSTVVDFADGAYELVSRDDANAGQIVMGFTVPECVRNDAVLPAGRIYLTLPTWTRDVLDEMRARKTVALDKASEATQQKERALQEMRDNHNPLTKALKFREACVAMEKFDYSHVAKYAAVPEEHELVALRDGVLLCTTGTVWCKNSQLLGPAHALLGHCTASVQDKGGFPVQDGRWGFNEV